MEKRSFKFYRKNEEEVMESLGLKPTKNSGSGWIEKEDGQNDYVICQLKSTDAQSIRVHQKDIRILEQNASVAHKIPMFATQFLNTGEVWLMIKPEDLTEVAKYLNTGKCEPFVGMDLSEHKDMTVVPTVTVKNGSDGRASFYKERDAKYDKTRRAT